MRVHGAEKVALVLITKIATAMLASYACIYILAMIARHGHIDLARDGSEFVFFCLFGGLVVLFSWSRFPPTFAQRFAIGPLVVDRTTKLFFGISLAVLAVEGLAIFLFASTENFNNRDIPEATVLGALNAVILAPAFEELAFRGLLFTGLRRVYNFFPTLLISSVCFALFHLENGIGYVVSMIPAGLLFGLAREKSGNVALPVALHAFINGTIATAGLVANSVARTMN